METQSLRLSILSSTNIIAITVAATRTDVENLYHFYLGFFHWPFLSKSRGVSRDNENIFQDFPSGGAHSSTSFTYNPFFHIMTPNVNFFGSAIVMSLKRDTNVSLIGKLFRNQRN